MVLSKEDAMLLREIKASYHAGDHIHDDHLRFFLQRTNQTVQVLKALGEQYHHAWRDLYMVRLAFEDMQKARKNLR